MVITQWREKLLKKLLNIFSMDSSLLKNWYVWNLYINHHALTTPGDLLDIYIYIYIYVSKEHEFGMIFFENILVDSNKSLGVVNIYIYIYIHIYIERERERERERVCVWEWERERECVCKRERESVCERVCVKERESAYVCVCEREREGGGEMWRKLKNKVIQKWWIYYEGKSTFRF